MTALDRYVRLETTGIWRESSDAPPKEVLVTFGMSTITLTDSSEAPLGHWALAGIQVIGQDGDATLYAMNTEGDETIAIRDTMMISAIAEVSRGEITPGQPAAGTRRRPPYLMLSVIALLMIGIASVGPGTIRSQAIRMVPAEQASEFGDRMLISLMETGGGICGGVAGNRALDRIAARLAPTDGQALRLRVLGLPDGAPVATLPGRTILLDRATIAEADGPEEVAGWVEIGLERSPVERLMETVGPAQNLRYVLTGEIGATALAHAADAALTPPTPAEVAEAIARLARLGIDPAPFEAALARRDLLPRTGTEDAPAFTPAAARTRGSKPLLPKQDWSALKAVCR
ncbi:MAG: hypothetical protein KDK03_06465 [Rhodobacteraceae bacterium]|nr:hypothetical protein [Paracoccaceae bacterium]